MSQRFDKTQLTEQYNSKIPKLQQTCMTKLEEHLQKQKDSVVSVKYTANFSKDYVQSLANDQLILTGVKVVVRGSYNLGPLDKMWFHPNYGKTLSLYSGGKYSAVQKLESLGGSGGAFMNFEVNDLGQGGYKPCTIVDNCSEESKQQVAKWVQSNGCIGEIYANARQLNLEATNLDINNQIATAMDARDLEYTQVTNVLMKDKDNYVFFNGCTNERAPMVLVSPLQGYVKLSQQPQMLHPTHMLSQTDFLCPSKFETPEKVKRLWTDCLWQGDNVCNAFVMQKPMPTAWKYPGLKNGVRFQMKRCSYGSCAEVADKLKPSETLCLTPTDSTCSMQNTHSYVESNKVKVLGTTSVLTNLLEHRDKFEFLSPDCFDGQHLLLERHIAELL